MAKDSLRHRKRSVFVLVLYALLIIVPWILTCVLAKRPIGASSYISHRGFTHSEMEGLRNWKIAIDVLNAIAALVTIPFLSLILAQAAVVFSQRQRPGQFLDLGDLFALSDRGWTHVSVVWNSIWVNRSHRAEGRKWSGAFFLPAAGLIFIGALQQPLYQILVRLDTISVTTCGDTQYQYLSKNASHCTDQRSSRSAYKPIGIDIEPAQMARIYHNKFIPRLAADLASISIDEEQPTLWSDWMSSKIWMTAQSSSSEYIKRYRSLRPWLPSEYAAQGPGPTFFAAGLPANSSTGVLREHILRLNTSIQCDNITRDAFPSPCPGEMPFATSLRRSNESELRVCVPGKLGTLPWTLSRSRQDITEELYLDIRDEPFKPRDSSPYPTLSSTIRCEVKTTRGYFELGNNFNNNSYGAVLDIWPSPEQMSIDFNDWVPSSSGRPGGGGLPTNQYISLHRCPGYSLTMNRDPDAGRYSPEPAGPSWVPASDWHVSGPLTTSAVALFGNTSWIHSAFTYSANMTWWEEARTGGQKPLALHRVCAGMPFANLFINAGSFPSPASQCRWADDGIAAGFVPTNQYVTRDRCRARDSH